MWLLSRMLLLLLLSGSSCARLNARESPLVDSSVCPSRPAARNLCSFLKGTTRGFSTCCTSPFQQIKMPEQQGRGRHRRPPPSSSAGPAKGGNEITGKRNTQAKNQRYARSLPVNVTSKQSSAASSSWLGWIWTWATGSSTSQVTSNDTLLVAYWDATTCSAWVQITVDDSRGVGPSTHSRTAQELWNSGFFGKGSLSRSEPTWKMRKVNEEKVKRQRQRGMKVYTPEELTAMRRRERMHAKIERARLAVKAGTQLPDGIVALGGTLTAEEEQLLAKRAEQEIDAEEEEEYGKHIPGLIYLGKGAQDDTQTHNISVGDAEPIDEHAIAQETSDMEWLHVSPVEIFFLAGMLGVLEIRDEQNDPMSLHTIYTQLLHSHTPAIIPPSPSTPSSVLCRPDNPFLLSYIAYHHYRSLGWAVKSGIKFCCDWLLYKRGPVFGHAEFAIVIIPVYQDPKDEESSPFPPHPASGDRDWVWFSTMNRVQSQVLKTLVLTHITIPPLSRTPPELIATPEALVQGLKEGRLHDVKEVSLRRWVPARMRA